MDWSMATVGLVLIALIGVVAILAANDDRKQWNYTRSLRRDVNEDARRIDRIEVQVKNLQSRVDCSELEEIARPLGYSVRCTFFLRGRAEFDLIKKNPNGTTSHPLMFATSTEVRRFLEGVSAATTHAEEKAGPDTEPTEED